MRPAPARTSIMSILETSDASRNLHAKGRSHVGSITSTDDAIVPHERMLFKSSVVNAGGDIQLHNQMILTVDQLVYPAVCTTKDTKNKRFCEVQKKKVVR